MRRRWASLWDLNHGRLGEFQVRFGAGIGVGSRSNTGEFNSTRSVPLMAEHRCVRNHVGSSLDSANCEEYALGLAADIPHDINRLFSTQGATEMVAPFPKRQAATGMCKIMVRGAGDGAEACMPCIGDASGVPFRFVVQAPNG